MKTGPAMYFTAMFIAWLAMPASASPDTRQESATVCALTDTRIAQLREQISLQRITRMDRPLPGILSPNGAYQYWLRSPANQQQPPLVSTIDIDSEREDLQRISLQGVVAPIEAKWVNEKLIYARWTWPKGIFAEMLHDVESGEVLHLTFDCVPFEAERN